MEFEIFIKEHLYKAFNVLNYGKWCVYFLNCQSTPGLCCSIAQEQQQLMFSFEPKGKISLSNKAIPIFLHLPLSD